ncbi:DNA repair helicase and transcription factor protein, putative [Trypanosoma brucei gambiense DAL972]|uniref:DNA 3'-5' helicase n=2 Tax=Trypanosoma brucei TaxID=5691 RepID=C9ZKL6_TRYB9|nr:DNA repair helicase and transcription factor protein, putative [Trypanosoma brucei gambiense DAL972]RHW73379.1 DNA repair helicase and transcription factor protein [Trypanosoma brucei equiperdum]CBH10232.1 DNA repair helicase and transcription factor protein, putative [Trypanosoma brucei gambiense DAL972]|eukprot:XP_011772522.1 DNA repair helicase and transcription factor protein, putative [Trypanosoma brucei gambiense DAL972]
MILGPGGRIFINHGHPAYPHLMDFLTACCEPVCRTLYVSEYTISPSSLSAATAEGTYSMEMVRNVIRYFRLDEQQQIPVDVERYAALERRVRDSVQDTSLDLPMEVGEAKVSANGDVKAEEGCEEATDELSPLAGQVKKEETKEVAAEPRRRFLSLSKRISAKSEPLVTRAVVNTGALQPLPADLEQMLREEENSSRVRIVLQPCLRPVKRRAVGGDKQHSDEQQCQRAEETKLAYFLTSPDRNHMEHLVSRLQDFLVPVLLHGTRRWVVSDVDRGVEERSTAESGRAKTLRRLFEAPSSASGRSVASKSLTNEGANGDGLGGGVGRRCTRIVYKSQVMDGKMRNVRERLYKELSVRADLFYDYVQDHSLHVCDLELSENVRLRPYQVASLERFRSGNKAHQGVIVLPCGAGKTLTGIGAAATVKKRTIVMCINVMSVLQWQREFIRWTNLSEDQVTVCIADKKQMPGDVFITTYSMLIARRSNVPEMEQSADAKLTAKILASVGEQPWGLLLLDEVHTALAHNFQEVLNKVKFKCVIGLSATLLREDDKIGDLRHLVGPKLYEANWLDLTRAGFLARVECAEIQCPLPKAFLTEYLESQSDGDPFARRGTTRMAHSVVCLNPYKLWCTQALLEFHRNRSPPDKVIIFCDQIDGIQYYAQHLHVPFMDGKTSDMERENLLQYFQHSDNINAIILSRVGDVALDIPCASVVIQISGLGASRRQEAQRLGRILRPKPASLDNVCSYFYTLVSQDTHEISQSYERQSWLRDQGFSYRVLQSDMVLQHFLRTGGKLCCVGPPRWWYECAGPSCDSAVAAKGTYWIPFSQEAALRMQSRFVAGVRGCDLTATVLRDTPRPPELKNMGVEEKWTVCFSDSCAPETFGTVQLVEGNPLLVRRICCGPLAVEHDCLHGGEECLQYAVQQMKVMVAKNSKNRIPLTT